MEHVSVFVADEMLARRWGRYELAKAMGGNLKSRLASVDLLLDVAPSNMNLRLGSLAEDLSRAFDVSPRLFANLEAQWLRAHNAHTSENAETQGLDATPEH
jgi:hypothetical protein